MVRLNKNQLSQAQLRKLYCQLDSVVNKSAHAGVILQELLGPEERVMIAKRLAIIILLVEGMSLYKISRLLKVSSATADKIQHQLKAGQFETILRCLGNNKKQYFSILETLDNILHLGGTLPHYNGLNRYHGI